MTTWFHQIRSDFLSTELLDVCLQGGKFRPFLGQGFLTWSPSKGIDISLLTNGGAALSADQFGHINELEIGSLIPQSGHLQLTAKTQDGHDVKIERLSFAGYRDRHDHETVVWNLNRSCLRSAVDFFSKDDVQTKVDYVSFLLSNGADLVWPKQHNITFLGGLEMTTALGDVTALEQKNGDVLVSIKPAEPYELSKLLDAVGFAFAFWAGKVLPLVAFQAHFEGATWCRLFPTQKWVTSAETPPLGRIPMSYQTWHEPLLRSALEFFATDSRGVIGPLIHSRLSCPETSFSVGILVLCSTLEGLAKEIARTTTVPPEIPQALSEQLAACFSNCGIPAEMTGRFLAFASRVNEPTAANAISSWCNSHFLGFDADDKQAWKYRNKSAHGVFNLYGGAYEARNTSVKRRDRLGNMFNKLVLYAIGYQGNYLDYATHREQIFPPPPKACDDGKVSVEKKAATE